MMRPHLIHEDDALLAIDKPAGMLVHPSPRQKRGTLAQWLAQRYPGIERVGDEPVRHGIVHRLDRQVSGVMVVAKTADAYRDLKRQFQDGVVEKHYTALVYGAPEQDSGTIDKRIAGNKGRRKTIREDSRPELLDQSQTALTYWWLRQQHAEHALLDVQPITGRTHQIRVHLASIGHHVVCDQMYAPQKPCLGLKRPFLHASTLTLADGRTCEAPLPADLSGLLERL